MSEHKKLYMKAMGFDEADDIRCELSGNRATEVHAIDCDGMGGSKRGHCIENLMAAERVYHKAFGDLKHLKYALYYRHEQELIDQGIDYDKERMAAYQRATLPYLVEWVLKEWASRHISGGFFD